MTLLMAWLAYPQLVRLQPQKLALALAVILIAVARPQLLPVLIRVGIVLAPILILIWLLQTPARKQL